jgi:hypothetical protein
MYNIELLDNTYTEPIKIKLTAKIKQKEWSKVAKISNEISRHRSYLNLLVRNTFLSWLSLILEQEIMDNYLLENNLSIWQFINGNAIDINSSRIILIPTETEDKSEISIPEEWFKIPEWVGNYYVAVEVNLEEDYLNFWGYTSYEEIINHSELDIVNYHRDLDGEYLENDLSLIALEYEYGWAKAPQIEPLPFVSKQQKNSLVTQIKDGLFPRYELDFSQWLNIISDEETRNSLFNARQPINLSQWLNQQLDLALTKGWQNAKDLIEELFTPDLSLQPVFSARRQPISLSQALDIIKQNNDTEAVNNILTIIPSFVTDDRAKEEVINALVNLIETSDNEEIRWNGALSLEKLSSDHWLSPCWQSKTINLPTKSESYQVGLLIGILPKSAHQLSLFVRIYDLEKNSFLPDNLKLQIIDENNNIYQEITSTQYDSIIQYKFWGNQREKFKLKVSIDNIYAVENFIV